MLNLPPELHYAFLGIAVWEALCLALRWHRRRRAFRAFLAGSPTGIATVDAPLHDWNGLGLCRVVACDASRGSRGEGLPCPWIDTPMWAGIVTPRRYGANGELECPHNVAPEDICDICACSGIFGDE